MHVSLLVCLTLALSSDAVRFHSVNELYEGSRCKMEDGTEGECVQLPKCPMRIREVQAGKRFSTSTGRCTFDNFVEIVCCPKSQVKPPIAIPPLPIADQPLTTIAPSLMSHSTTIKSIEVEKRPATETTLTVNRITETIVTSDSVTEKTTTTVPKIGITDTIPETIPLTEITMVTEQSPIIETTQGSNFPRENTTKTGNDFTAETSPLAEIITKSTLGVTTSSPTTEKTAETYFSVDTTMPIIPEALTTQKQTNSTTETSNMSDDRVIERPAEAACKEYQKGFLSDDRKTIILIPVLIGEPVMKSGEFPFTAALGYQINKDNSKLIKYNCGGTLITRQHILTAAHCVSSVGNEVPIEVRLGKISLDDNSSNVQIITVGDITVHPQYRNNLNYHDIAIIKLSSPVSITQQVMPTCLQYIPISNLESRVNMSQIMAGWGVTRVEDADYNFLPAVPSLRLIKKFECAEYYKNYKNLPEGIDDSMICLQDKNIMKRVDSCEGHSGVPLVQMNRGWVNVIGIEVVSQNCGSDIPAIYIDIFNYIDWIEEVVWPDKKLTSIPILNPDIDVRMA